MFLNTHILSIGFLEDNIKLCIYCNITNYKRRREKDENKSSTNFNIVTNNVFQHSFCPDT